MASNTTPEYSNWSHEELIKRVTQLESELKAQHDKLSSVLPQPTASATKPAVPATTEEPKKKKKRAAFDPSRYTSRHIALKFAYIGGRYNGFEFHPGNETPLPTIEEELWKALVKTRLIFPPSLYGEDGAPPLDGAAIFDDVESLPSSIRGDWRGSDYSKCGRTDKGVSAFGQVIGVRVRSARPKEGSEKKGKKEEEVVGGSEGVVVDGVDELAAIVPSAPPQDSVEDIAPEAEQETRPPFDPIKDELPYIRLLNRVLPSDIRVLAWCPNPPSNFDARYSCKERKYRYFFTSPAFLPVPGPDGLIAHNGRREGWLHINAMQKAASHLVGTHDYRNFCKIDASKQLTSFTRRISEAKIELVGNVGSPEFVARPNVTRLGWSKEEGKLAPVSTKMQLYSFDVKGSAFLWHQVRCMVAVLFLVGQGLEKPEVVQELLDVARTPSKPVYEMASDQPLVLWGCTFSTDPDKGKFNDQEEDKKKTGYIDRGVGGDELKWVYAADAGPEPISSVKWNDVGIMSELWAGWRKAKIDEVLTAQLLDMVASQGSDGVAHDGDPLPQAKPSIGKNQKVFEGYDRGFPRGKYVPVMQKQRMDPVEVINGRWLARKGKEPFATSTQAVDE